MKGIRLEGMEIESVRRRVFKLVWQDCISSARALEQVGASCDYVYSVDVGSGAIRVREAKMN